MWSEERRIEELWSLVSGARILLKQLIEEGWSPTEQRQELYVDRDIYIRNRSPKKSIEITNIEVTMNELFEEIERARAVRNERLHGVIAHTLSSGALEVPTPMDWPFFIPPLDDDPLEDFEHHSRLWDSFKHASGFSLERDNLFGTAKTQLEAHLWTVVLQDLDSLRESAAAKLRGCLVDESERSAGQLLFLYAEAEKLRPFIMEKLSTSSDP